MVNLTKKQFIKKCIEVRGTIPYPEVTDKLKDNDLIPEWLIEESLKLPVFESLDRNRFLHRARIKKKPDLDGN